MVRLHRCLALTPNRPSPLPAPSPTCPAMRADSGIDMTKKEDYLSDADFEKVGGAHPLITCRCRRLAAGTEVHL